MQGTHFICTIGPASEKPEVLEKLVLAGMDIARLNFSHATFEQFLRVQKAVRNLNKKHSKDVKLLVDLQGPRMRVGILPEKGLELKEGKEVWFSTNSEEKGVIHIDDPYLHEDVRVGEPMFLTNGEITLHITEKQGNKFRAVVEHGGTLYSRKGVNLPNTNLTTTGLTKKDIKDAEFASKHNADYVAMSFVKDGQDLRILRGLLDNPRTQVISKIERKQALPNLEEIIKESDVIMVARGDLGIEIPIEDLPLVQKQMIAKASKMKKPSIVATQMLMSMVEHPHPTRAEVSDVSNAVLDGAWAVMLSDETAFGKYPVEALSYLVKIAQRAEKHSQKKLNLLSPARFARFLSKKSQLLHL